MTIFLLFVIAIGVLLLSKPGQRILKTTLNLAVTGFVLLIAAVIIGVIVYFVKEYVNEILWYGGVLLVITLFSVGLLKFHESKGGKASDLIGLNSKQKTK